MRWVAVARRDNKFGLFGPFESADEARAFVNSDLAMPEGLELADVTVEQLWTPAQFRALA